MERASDGLSSELKTHDAQVNGILVQNYHRALAAAAALETLEDRVQVFPVEVLVLQDRLEGFQIKPFRRITSRLSCDGSFQNEVSAPSEQTVSNYFQAGFERLAVDNDATRLGLSVRARRPEAGDTRSATEAVDSFDASQVTAAPARLGLEYFQIERLRTASRLLRRAWRCAKTGTWTELVKARILHYQCSLLLTPIPTDTADMGQPSEKLQNHIESELRAQCTSSREELLECLCRAACSLCLDSAYDSAQHGRHECLGVLLWLQIDLDLEAVEVVQRLVLYHSAQVVKELQRSSTATLLSGVQFAIRAVTALLDTLCCVQEQSLSKDTITLRLRSLEWDQIVNSPQNFEDICDRLNMADLQPRLVALPLDALDSAQKQWVHAVLRTLSVFDGDQMNNRQNEEAAISLSDVMREVAVSDLAEQPPNADESTGMLFFRSAKRKILLRLVQPLETLVSGEVSRHVVGVSENYKRILLNLVAECAHRQTAVAYGEDAGTAAWTPLRICTATSRETRSRFRAPRDSPRASVTAFELESDGVPLKLEKFRGAASAETITRDRCGARAASPIVPLLLESFADILLRACSSIENCIVESYDRICPLFRFFSKAEVEFFYGIRDNIGGSLADVVIGPLRHAVGASSMLDGSETKILPCIAFAICFAADVFLSLQQDLENFGSLYEVIDMLKRTAETSLRAWLECVVSTTFSFKRPNMTHDELQRALVLQMAGELKEQSSRPEPEKFWIRYSIANLRSDSQAETWHAIWSRLNRDYGSAGCESLRSAEPSTELEHVAAVGVGESGQKENSVRSICGSVMKTELPNFVYARSLFGWDEA
ncbi:hypothetical protein CCYA_CCYA16G4129 [Cyanidiococcus yangmingshanensis]|nr:hypothetical protein CCYA_CCYA16G4129 [Cyanidiococcus yangmingshanensis]